MRGRMLAAVIMGAIGLIWVLQGTGVLPGSGFMSGDIRWALIGLVLVVAAIGLAAVSARRRAP
jgi:hypothetical protein